ncbi:MAG TPA: sigma-70 family RNA polymerase sigma factor [Fimbriimonas sp.]|nr:sigma-70 family RNA polymerase sigma factor [Fimbriimonas sp.]
MVRDLYKPSYNFAYRLTGNAAEAEDLVQESFLRAYRFFNRYDDRLPFSSWLYRIMVNAHIDLVRRKNRIKTTTLDIGGADGNATWDVPDQAASPDQEMLKSSLEEPVQRGLLAMTPEFRTAVLLADVEGLAYEEVAEIMGTSVGTVRSRIHRGRKQLRSYLIEHSPSLYGGMRDEL